MTRGIGLAQGEYFAKIDSDDYVVDDFSANMINWSNQIRDVESVYAVSAGEQTADVRCDAVQRPFFCGWPSGVYLQKSRAGNISGGFDSGLAALFPKKKAV